MYLGNLEEITTRTWVCESLDVLIPFHVFNLHIIVRHLTLCSWFLSLSSLCKTIPCQSMASCHSVSLAVSVSCLLVSLQHINLSIHGILPPSLSLSLSPTANLQNNIIPGVIFLNYALEPYSIISQYLQKLELQSFTEKPNKKRNREDDVLQNEKETDGSCGNQSRLTNSSSSSCRPSSPFLCSWILLA